MISPDRLSHLIGLIYQCVLEPPRWPEVMQCICDELNFRTGVISILALPGGEPLLAATTGFEEPWLDRVFFYASELVDLWGGDDVIRNLPLDEPAVLSLINPAALADDTAHPFHEAFNKPQGFVDALAIGLTRDSHSIGTIGFNRHADAGQIGAREIEIMRLLIPHLQRAATISRVLEVRSIAARQIEAALAGLAIPVALVASDLSIRFANPALADLLATAERNLDLVNGRLRLRFGPAQTLLAATLNKCASGGRIDGEAAFGMPIGTPQERMQSLHVLPLPREGQGEAVFAIILSPASAALDNAGEMVASLFGLTEAERRVFELIAGGQAVDEAARRLGVAESTIRTHLLRIFAKTNCGRQAELVALAAAFRPMVRHQIVSPSS